ncbi:prephenate dehydrogenase [Candidatus Termititenax dinenymphae]|uniref:Prephenate dehydrogenase n=1 Tax=Candidatus Termititenax dinenymphae TaxID=2218523 RepID=A0A388TKY0_9BACT|nr:prephenate dehydrogenase [Candidatus Termititenax dinenymphae]
MRLFLSAGILYNVHMFQKIAFIGLGLIGGSLARAAREKFPSVWISAKTASSKTLAYAYDNGIIQGTPGSLAELVGDADLIILATPIELITAYVKQIYPLTKPGAIIIDTASTKQQIVTELKKYSDKFIGCHPMFGSEKTGIANSSAALLHGTRVAFTPYKNTPRGKLLAVMQFFKRLGCRPCKLGAKEHDAAVASISHIPYFGAVALLQLADDATKAALASTGFQSCTRVAESDPLWGVEVARSNRKEVLRHLKKLQRELSWIEQLIGRGDYKGLKEYLEFSRQIRRGIYR